MTQQVGYYNYLVPNMNTFSLPFPILPLQNQSVGFVIPPIPVLLSPVDMNKTTNYSTDPNTERSLVDEILPDFRCKICSVLIPTFSEFEAHSLTHGDKIKEECNGPCETEFGTQQVPEECREFPSILQPLQRDGDDAGFPCPYCPKKFKVRPALSEHVVRHRITKDVACVLCQSTFASISSLRKHLLMFHCKDKDRRQCTYCSYRCFQTSDLEKHISRRHTRDFRYKCSHCVKGFATPKELKNHEIRKHLKFV